MRLRDLSKTSKGIFIVTALASFSGFVDASYLVAKKVQGGSINCFVFSGCDAVSNSVYSTFLGLPVAIYGVAFYLSIFILSVLFLERREPRAAIAAAVLSALGFIATLYLLYLQAFAIGQFCFYCVLSATFSSVIFGSMTAAWLAAGDREPQKA